MLKIKTVLLPIVIALVSPMRTQANNLESMISSTNQTLLADVESSAKKVSYGSDFNNSSIVIGFSPEGSAQKAILSLIKSAQKEIRLSAYSFTSPEVVSALIAAKRRGVDVKLVVDYKSNTGKSSISAMNLIGNAGIPIRTIDKYAIHHDKFIVVDEASVETGSFNYSRAANVYNSENAIVLYNMPQVADQYLLHWESRWNDGIPWGPSY